MLVMPGPDPDLRTLPGIIFLEYFVDIICSRFHLMDYVIIKRRIFLRVQFPDRIVFGTAAVSCHR